MDNKTLLLMVGAIGAYLLVTNAGKAKSGPPRRTDGNDQDCLGWGTATSYLLARWLSKGRPMSELPDLAEIIPDFDDGDVCITREYIDELVDGLA